MLSAILLILLLLFGVLVLLLFLTILLVVHVRFLLFRFGCLRGSSMPRNSGFIPGGKT